MKSWFWFSVSRATSLLLLSSLPQLLFSALLLRAHLYFQVKPVCMCVRVYSFFVLCNWFFLPFFVYLLRFSSKFKRIFLSWTLFAMAQYPNLILLSKINRLVNIDDFFEWFFSESILNALHLFVLETFYRFRLSKSEWKWCPHFHINKYIKNSTFSLKKEALAKRLIYF